MIDNAEGLKVVIPMYNLIKYSNNNSNTSDTLCIFCKDISMNPITTSEPFRYMTNVAGKKANDSNTKEIIFLVILIIYGER